MENSTETAAAYIRTLFDVAIAMVDPSEVVAAELSPEDGKLLIFEDGLIPVPERIWIAAVGKAACRMAAGAVEALGDAIVGGVVITKDGHADIPLPESLRVFEAAHPIPDERGVAATREMLKMVESAGPDDLIVALISGGGSALLEAPRPPVTLEDLAATTDLLLRAGAPIDALNAVRRPLSLVKGGGLRRAGGETRFATLVLSDVLSNDVETIASGPTVLVDPAPETAVEVLQRYGLFDRVPERVRAMLSSTLDAVETVDVSKDALRLTADNFMAVETLHVRAALEGLKPDSIWVAMEGEAAELGRAWVKACKDAPKEVGMLLGGGEATVTVRGDGIGGRNTEFALAAALALESAGNLHWMIASLATDGQDGPTDVAGAIADPGTAARARAAGVDPEAALANNDSLRVFDAAGGAVRTGPTGTNVNDLYLAIRLLNPRKSTTRRPVYRRRR